MRQRKKRDASRSARHAKSARLYGEKLNFDAMEAYKLLRTNLFFCLPAKEGRTCSVVGVTSSIQGEGKSTTAINLAYMLAESGKKVCLIEGDMRAPTFKSRLKLDSVDGLSHVLAGMKTSPQDIFSTTLHPNLRVVSAGEIPPNPAELLGSTRMVKFVELLKGMYNYIIIDLPPIMAVADALAVSAVLDGLIFVVGDGICTQHELRDAMQRLDVIHDKILGFVVTHYEGSGGKHGKYGRYGKYGN